MAESLLIEATQLRKKYGDKVAVSDLTLQLGRGEVFGFLGPNGAGKTTSIKMLLGLIRPTSGSGRLLGAPLGDARVRGRVGFLPEHFRFHDWMTATEFLDMHGELYGMDRASRRRRVPQMLERVGLSEHAARRLRTYSKGMLQRAGLAMAMLNKPDLIFLDEPTSGLDPIGRRMVRDVIRELREQGTAVFLNSHLLSEVEVTCDRVVFIKNGEVVRQVSLHSTMGGLNVELRVGQVTRQLIEGLREWSSDTRVETSGDRVSLNVTDEDALPAVARFVVGSGAELYAMTPQRMSLEELFVQIVGSKDEGL